MYRTKYLSEKALIGLKNYKYVSGDYSFMDTKLTPFWNKCVEYLPLWMAPNMVTLIGSGVIVLNVFQYLIFDLTLRQEFAPACYVFSGLAFFFYQTMDAIDGKQARRTG
jgi:ethanolaminephosphotransferase